jgi:hypothetical protein
MNETSKDKKGWRISRRILIGLAIFATLIALFYAEEDWRGWHAWNQYRQQLEAAGTQLDLKAFIPKAVPGDQNFAAMPLIEFWFADRTNFNKRWTDNYFLASQMVDSRTSSTPSTTVKDGNRHFTDLVAWEMAFEAIQSGQTNSDQKFKSGKLDLASRAAVVPAVLEGLKANEMVLTKLRDASQRSYSRYPVVYDLDNPWGILLPHLGNVKRAVQRLQLRACAELAAGRSDEAVADVKLSLYLADSVKDEPFLISYLVRIACVQIAIQPVWEGLADHAWSDAQLQELQASFQQYDFMADLKRPLDAERAAGILTVELIRKNGLNYLNYLGDPTKPVSATSSSRRIASLIDLFVASGWYYQEEFNYCRLFHMLLGADLDFAKKQISPKQVESNKGKFGQALAGIKFSRIVHHQIIASMLVPALGGMPIKAATAQTAADEAMLACALERYRLANGQFPGTLEALVPRFISQLPNDVISGEPYKYHRTNDGQFVLYSVGWNETDDGGVPGKTLFDEKEGDWVWQYPVK